jgi:asparagine synthase (glutamine-hydrolysing)
MNPPSPSFCSGQPVWQGQASPDDQTATEVRWREQIARVGPEEAARGAMGPFAVGLDSGTGQAVGLVDRFSMQTLCHTVRDGRLQVAARADQLAQGAEIDPQALFDYLYFHAIPSPKTVFKGVHRLPPGQVIWQDATGVHQKRYWAPSFREAGTGFEDAKREFRTLLERAVAADLDGTTPACFLSGGTDSSTIAGLIAKVSGQAPLSYSIGFEAEGYDEMAYARIAARHFKTEHREHYITPADLVRLIPLVAAHHDQPFGNSSAVPAYFCALKAREDGVTRLLAGDGGDELFGGNTRYATQRIFSWYQGVPGPLRSAVLEPLADSGWLDRVPVARKGMSYVRQARVPMPDRLETYNLLYRVNTREMLTPAFLAQVDDRQPERQQRAVWSESEGASFVNRMLAYDWRFTLAENDLPKVRGSAELAGVAVRYPFLHQDLVDFSSRLPTHYKLKGLKLRWFFKEALRGFLPDEIITKKKHGFGLPFGPWTVKDPALGALARDSLEGIAARGLVQPAFVRTLMQDLLPLHPGFYGELVWILMMLEQWLRHHRPDHRIG